MSWKSGHTTSQSWNTASNASSRIGCGSGYSSFQTKPIQPWPGFGATSSSSAKKTKPEDRTPQHQAKIDSCKKSKEKKKAEDQQRKVDIANTKNNIENCHWTMGHQQEEHSRMQREVDAYRSQNPAPGSRQHSSLNKIEKCLQNAKNGVKKPSGR